MIREDVNALRESIEKLEASVAYLAERERERQEQKRELKPRGSVFWDWFAKHYPEIVKRAGEPGFHGLAYEPEYVAASSAWDAALSAARDAGVVDAGERYWNLLTPPAMAASTHREPG